MDAERLTKYEAWIVELEARQQRLMAHRPGYARLFWSLPLVSLAGFFWNAWVGAGTLLTGIMCCTFGFYVINVRADDYMRELQSMRREVARLRGLAPDETIRRPTW